MMDEFLKYLGVALDYDGEVLKIFFPKIRLFEAMIDVADKIGKNNQKMPQVGVLWRLSSVYEELRLPKKLDLRRIPLAKSVIS